MFSSALGFLYRFHYQRLTCDSWLYSCINIWHANIVPITEIKWWYLLIRGPEFLSRFSLKIYFKLIPSNVYACVCVFYVTGIISIWYEFTLSCGIIGSSWGTYFFPVCCFGSEQKFTQFRRIFWQFCLCVRELQFDINILAAILRCQMKHSIFILK